MNRPTFPLCAILPDLWTVYRGDTAVSQHATLGLALRYVQVVDALHPCVPSQLVIKPPEHSPLCVAMAKAAIDKARQL